MRTKTIVAIACSDLHLSLTPPSARIDEPNWLDAQARALNELKELQKQHDVPILCAGDIFDRWNPPVQLVNWAIDNLPKMTAIPGQHDLPFHQVSNIKASAYWTLVKAGKIVDMSTVYQGVYGQKNILVQGFPWGEEIKPFEYKPINKREKDNRVKIALIHKYIWVSGCAYPTATETSKLEYTEKYEGWDTVVYGDNHKGFIRNNPKGTSIINCGTFLKRHVDDIPYNPSVGLIYDNGTIEKHELNCNDDIITEPKFKLEVPENFERLDGFIGSLKEMENHQLEFESILRKSLFESPEFHDRVKEIIKKALEEK